MDFKKSFLLIIANSQSLSSHLIVADRLPPTVRASSPKLIPGSITLTFFMYIPFCHSYSTPSKVNLCIGIELMQFSIYLTVSQISEVSFCAFNLASWRSRCCYESYPFTTNCCYLSGVYNLEGTLCLEDLDTNDVLELLDSDLCMPLLIPVSFLPYTPHCLIDFAFRFKSVALPRCNVIANNFFVDTLARLIWSDYWISDLPLIKALVFSSCLFCSSIRCAYSFYIAFSILASSCFYASPDFFSESMAFNFEKMSSFSIPTEERAP